MWRRTKASEAFQEESFESRALENEEEKKWKINKWTVLPSSRSFSKFFERQYGFKLTELSSFEKIIELMYRPTDAASLGVARALFGLCMVLDVVEERGLADIDVKWGDPMECHFPLIHGTKPLTLPWMIVVYTIMWLGAIGIMLGYRFKIACACFVLPYWYLFLLDKSYWNNHTYLYGLVATLFLTTDANAYFALDARNSEKNRKATVPFWNYFILKFQFFALYFLAGLKKSSKEWLDGYAMTNLSKHWVFDPFKLFLTTEQTDFFIVHWFAFIFDLTVGFWMLIDKTRIPAMIFCTLFHLMNSRLFSIGMFPFVCLATMPLFCRVNWPRKVQLWFSRNCLAVSSKKLFKQFIVSGKIKDETKSPENSRGESENEIPTKEEKSENSDEIEELDISKDIKEEKLNQRTRSTKKQKCVVTLLFSYIFLQFFLPYSHFITKGYNNWVPGLYGYSWDMMVHSWDTILIVVKVHDNENGVDYYLDPDAWVQTDRWVKHGDMARQYAFCLKDNLMQQREKALTNTGLLKGQDRLYNLSENISIYIDVWCSLNGRFQQRLFNPYVDMLTADWHPFKPVSYVMPLLTQYNSYRQKMDEIQENVYSWSNYTDVLFVADFPGMSLENFISTDFSNVTLTILEGEVTYGEEKKSETITLSKEKSLAIDTGKFHKIKTTSPYPACYMYTYTNQTKEAVDDDELNELIESRRSFPIMKEFQQKIKSWMRALEHIFNAFFYLVYGVPMVRRIRVNQ